MAEPVIRGYPRPDWGEADRIAALERRLRERDQKIRDLNRRCQQAESKVAKLKRRDHVEERKTAEKVRHLSAFDRCTLSAATARVRDLEGLLRDARYSVLLDKISTGQRKPERYGFVADVLHRIDAALSGGGGGCLACQGSGSVIAHSSTSPSGEELVVCPSCQELDSYSPCPDCRAPRQVLAVVEGRQMLAPCLRCQEGDHG